MHNLEILLQKGSDVRLMKCLVKYVTVVAPIRTEDQDYTLMILLRIRHGFLNFDFRVRVFVVEIWIWLQSGRHFDHIGVRSQHDAPPVTLL